jgi:secretion/DNA translocation related TadE-like protein
MTQRGPKGGSERGSATVLVLAFTAVLLLVGCALGVVAAVIRAHRVAQSGADLAALSAARVLTLGGDPCAEGARVATANGVRVTACLVDGATLTLTVTAPGPHWLGQAADLSAQARAGPGEAGGQSPVPSD